MGGAPFDEVASWARERLGIAPSASDLEEYARKLRDLGFFDFTEVRDAVSPAPTAATVMRERRCPRRAMAPAGRAKTTICRCWSPTAPPMGAGRHTGGDGADDGDAGDRASDRQSAEDRPAPPRTPAPATHSTTGRAAVAAEPPGRSSAGSIIGIVLVIAVGRRHHRLREVHGRRPRRGEGQRRCWRRRARSCGSTTARRGEEVRGPDALVRRSGQGHRRGRHGHRGQSGHAAGDARVLRARSRRIWPTSRIAPATTRSS